MGEGQAREADRDRRDPTRGDRRDPDHPDRRVGSTHGGRRATDKFICPGCGHHIAGRAVRSGPGGSAKMGGRSGHFVRRRECEHCGHRFSTEETVMP